MRLGSHEAGPFAQAPHSSIFACALDASTSDVLAVYRRAKGIFGYEVQHGPDALLAPLGGNRASCSEGETGKCSCSQPIPDALLAPIMGYHASCSEGWADEVPSSKDVPTVLSLDTMPRTPPEMPVSYRSLVGYSYCQRPCPPLSSPQES